MKLSFSFCVLAFTLWGGVGFADVEKQEFSASEIRKVNIENTAGKIVVVATDGPHAVLSVSKNKFGSSCVLKTEKEGDKLKVKVEKTGWFGADCDADIELKVGKLVDLELEIGAGSIRVAGVSGELEFKVGSGEVQADGSFEKIDGQVGNGTIQVKGLTGSGEVKTGNGRIDLTYASVPPRGKLDVKTGNGGATLSFPKGSKINSELKAAMGSFKDELGSSSDSAFKVSASAGLGEVAIKAF